MIYPEITGKSGEHLRLNTLEAVWIQGKLRMWGAVVVYRWG
ncbi:late gene regulator [Escherichia coli]|uniref:Late gene regulator n=1 Tax=Escherichia coli TaxID=562 RepID=A0A376DHH9_ECOLX|nr:late gene regulator [Escherichia coli]